jgi:rhomboid protease GluP
MAVGLTPKHSEQFDLGDLTQAQFLVLANDVVKEMQWRISHISDNGIIAYTGMSMSSWGAEIKIKVESGIADIQSKSTGSEMIDWGKNKKNVNTFISNLEALKSTVTITELDAKYEALKEELVPSEEDTLRLPPPKPKDHIKAFFSIFIPREHFFITPIIIDLNILIFILMAISGANILMPSNEIMLQWGANFKPMTLEGQWWRLITNCFLHIGIMHLLFNMYALLYIGVLLEPHLGRIRFLTAYLLTGIAASVTSLWWHDFTISAGASGAIFGMYGVFLSMLTTSLIEKEVRQALLTSISLFVGYNLLFGLKGGVDNAAHIGGLLSGIVIGYALIPGLKKPEQKSLKFGALGMLTILVLAASLVVYKKLPNDIKTYDDKIKVFADMESKALEVYKLPEDAPRDKMLYEIKEVGIHYWEESIKLIESFDKMELPAPIKTRNSVLKEYCELRIKCYELIYKAVSEDTDQYKEQIDDYNTQIEAKIKQLSGGNDSK